MWSFLNQTQALCLPWRSPNRRYLLPATPYLSLLQGGKSVEVRPVGVTKGLALQRLIEHMAQQYSTASTAFDFALCVGHLLTRDENIYSLLEGQNIEVRAQGTGEGGGRDEGQYGKECGGHGVGCKRYEWCTCTSSLEAQRSGIQQQPLSCPHAPSPHLRAMPPTSTRGTSATART